MLVTLASLSPEITILIASYLQRWECENRANKDDRGQALLPPYATISRSWQYAIEYRTFRGLEVNNNDLLEFSRIVVGHRRRLLRRLDFMIVLPTYGDKACAKFETLDDKETNNQVFTKAIRDILCLLRSWHDEFHSSAENNLTEQPLCFCIGDCYSPGDCQYRGWDKYQEDKEESISGHRHDLFRHRYESSLLRIENVDDIPRVPQITSFQRSSSERKVEPRTLAMLASRFPSLSDLYWMLRDDEISNTSLRQQTHYGRPALDISHRRPLYRSQHLADALLNYFRFCPSNLHDTSDLIEANRDTISPRSPD